MSNVVYSGQNQTELKSFLRSEGGIVEIEFRHIDGIKVTTAEMMLVDDAISLEWNGKEFKGPCDLVTHLGNIGFSRTNPTGSNTEGGDKANAVLGNYDVYGNAFVNGKSLSEHIGKKITSKVQSLSKKTQTVSRLSVETKKEKKIDNRPMRPAHGKGVWNQSYINSKKLNLPEMYSKYGRANLYHDLCILTVSEFEGRYGIAA